MSIQAELLARPGATAVADPAPQLGIAQQHQQAIPRPQAAQRRQDGIEAVGAVGRLGGRPPIEVGAPREPSPIASLPVAAAVPVVLFVIFEIWFLVPLPKGPVEAWLGY